MADLTRTAEEEPLEASPATASSYSLILKSTAVIGGSSLVNVAFAVLRNKAMALLLGPAGVGLIGLYSSIADIAQTIAGLGIQASGVRQIAEAAGAGDGERVARTAAAVQQISFILGIAGSVALFLLAAPVAALTFQDYGQAVGVALLAAAIVFRVVSAGQIALVQGMRRIPDIARISVASAFLSTAVSIPMVYVYREQAIVPSLVAIAAVSFLPSWWYSRRLEIKQVALTLRQLGAETIELLQLGLVFLASGLLTFGAAYAVRIIVLQNEGIQAVGNYQAAWALGGLYAGFILQAMGADFYPRLTAVAHDNGEGNRLVNEQAHVGMLLAGPGLVATLTAAPLVIAIFYSSEFTPAIELLRWICLGMMLRIVSWPMGFIVLAKGAKKIFFWTEIAATVVHVGLAWALVSLVGVSGAGMAFFGLYVWHGLLIYAVARRLSGFRWSADNFKLGSIFLAATILVFAAVSALPFWPATVFGAAVTLATGLYSLRLLLKLLPASAVPSVFKGWAQP